jgi:hypothetical protein
MPISKKPYCPSGYILRESYLSKLGKRISARCIRRTGLMRGKSSEKKIHLLKIADQRAKHALQLSKKAGLPTPMHCPKGMTFRKGYTRRSYNRKIGTHVKHALAHPTCIKKYGLSKSKRQLIILDPDDHYLSEFGYYDVKDKTKEQRHDSLHKLIKHFIPIKGSMATYNYVIHALNARYILNRNTNHKIGSIFKQDRNAMSKEYKIIKQNTKMKTIS